MQLEKKEIIKNQVNNVVGLLNGIYKMQTDGTLTEDEAKKQARNIVKSLKYGENGYFWIDNVNGQLADSSSDTKAMEVAAQPYLGTNVDIAI